MEVVLWCQTTVWQEFCTNSSQETCWHLSFLKIKSFASYRIPQFSVKKKSFISFKIYHLQIPRMFHSCTLSRINPLFLNYLYIIFRYDDHMVNFTFAGTGRFFKAGRESFCQPVPLTQLLQSRPHSVQLCWCNFVLNQINEITLVKKKTSPPLLGWGGLFFSPKYNTDVSKPQWCGLQEQPLKTVALLQPQHRALYKKVIPT